MTAGDFMTTCVLRRATTPSPHYRSGWRIYDGGRLYDDMRFATCNDAIAALSQRDSRFPDR
jgi:hypothetical protein